MTKKSFSTFCFIFSDKEMKKGEKKRKRPSLEEREADQEKLKL